MQYGTALVFLTLVIGITLTSIVLRNKLRNMYRW
jgi:ABC-type phosphate transport system permease subunit